MHHLNLSSSFTAQSKIINHAANIKIGKYQNGIMLNQILRWTCNAYMEAQ